VWRRSIGEDEKIKKDTPARFDLYAGFLGEETSSFERLGGTG